MKSLINGTRGMIEIESFAGYVWLSQNSLDSNNIYVDEQYLDDLIKQLQLHQARITQQNAPRSEGGLPVIARTSAVDLTTHKHRCMRCAKEFDCKTPDICVAKYDVLPTIITKNSSGKIVMEDHCTGEILKTF